MTNICLESGERNRYSLIVDKRLNLKKKPETCVNNLTKRKTFNNTKQTRKKKSSKMASEDRNSTSANSLQNGKSFSISSILAKETEQKEMTESKDSDQPAVVSKIGFPSLDASKLFSLRPEGASSFPVSPLSSLPAWYQWYTAGHQFLQQLHHEKLSRK